MSLHSLAGMSSMLMQSWNSTNCLLRQHTNEVLPILMKPLAELLRERRRATIEPPGSTELSSKGHREIFEAVKNRDNEQARDAMLEHLRMVRGVLGTFSHTDDEKIDAA